MDTLRQIAEDVGVKNSIENIEELEQVAELLWNYVGKCLI